MNDQSKKSLMLRCCYLHYISGYNMQDVAARLKISRFRVSRYIAEARDKDIITLRVNDPNMDYEVLALELEQGLGLDQVHVVPIAPDADRDSVRCSIGKTGARIVSEFNEKTSLAITWGRTIAYMLDEIPSNRIRIQNVVEMAGSVGEVASSIAAHATALTAADKLNANYIQFPAPIIVDNPEMAAALSKESTIKRALDVASTCDVAVSGIGPVHDLDSCLCKSGFVSEEELSDLDSQGAVGSLLGRFFDKDGKECDTKFRNRIMALSFEDFLRVPNRIFLAGGMHKIGSIYALAKSRMITSLVTDNETAARLLKLIK